DRRRSENSFFKGIVGSISQRALGIACFSQMIVPYGRDARFGSFAIGSTQQQVRPCPLCPDSDQITQRSEMTRCARSGSGLPSFGHLIDSGVLLTLDRTGVENFSAEPLKPKTGFFIFPSPP